MMSYRTAQKLASYIALFLGYLIAITPAGWFRAWTARFMGDDTGEEAGLLTFNPFAHISLSGLFFLFMPFFRVGWGRDVPVNFNAIYGKHRNLKYALALFSNSFMHWLVATLCLVAIIALLGPKMLLSYGSDISSLNIAYTRVLMECVQLSLWLAVVSLIINGITYFMAVHKPELAQEPMVGWYYLFAYLIVAILIGGDIGRSMTYASIKAGQCLACFFGIGGA